MAAVAGVQARAAPQPADTGFVCFDNRLREAAQREGFTVLPERV
jgi:hypothetical protein